MTHLPLYMIAFLCGMSMVLSTHYPQTAMEAAIYEAYNIGKAECPKETVCAEAIKLADVAPISFDDLTYGDFNPHQPDAGK